MDEPAAGSPLESDEDGPNDFDAREAFFTGALQQARRGVNLAEAVQLQLMLAGTDAMLLEEEAIAGELPRPDDPVVRGFFMHQANELRTTRFDIERRLEAARMLRDRLPATWAVFLDGRTSERAACIAAGQAIGLAAEHLPAYDTRAAEVVQTERPTAVERELSDYRDELDPAAAAERHVTATNRRYVRARAAGDGQGVLEIKSTAADVAAAYDRIRAHAVAAHGREGECRTLGALMVDGAIDAILTGTMRGPDQGGPSYPAERLGEPDQAGQPSQSGAAGDQSRKLIDATILVVVPAGVATGATDGLGQVAGMGAIDADTARTIVQHTRAWTRVLIDPIHDTVLGIDSHERYIPAGLKKLLHYRQPTCGCGCGLPAHRADIDHLVRVEHDGRTRLTNLHVLCRPSHQGKDAGYADVTLDRHGTPQWHNKWGGMQKMKVGIKIRAVDDSTVTPF